jgi:hypothetical protein
MVLYEYAGMRRNVIILTASRLRKEYIVSIRRYAYHTRDDSKLQVIASKEAVCGRSTYHIVMK